MNDPTRSVIITVEVPLPNDLNSLRVRFDCDGNNAGSLIIGLASQGTTDRDFFYSTLPPLPGEVLEPLARILTGLEAFLRPEHEEDRGDATDLEGCPP